ncbi:MAG: DUF4974 domain-containing protein, partial [Tannerellaceae bacterium]|nr:DUF4974 domain-containing protein [Tannerellaceae bacterium]
MKTRLYLLYINYLAGKYSKEEFLEMKKTLSGSTEKELEELMQSAWEEDLPLPSMTESTRNRLKTQILSLTTHSLQTTKIPKKWWMTAAAILLLLVSFNIFFYLNNRTMNYDSPFIVYMERGQKASVTLPDQSNVFMNSETELIYDLNNRKQRKVYLSGEAFFEVQKNRSFPFIVDLGELEIEVLGTSFNVQTYNDEDFIEASLVEGSIKLSGKRLDKSYYLKPMEQFIYSKIDGTLRIVSFDGQKELGWMDNRLVFRSEPLHKIIHRIERWYGVKIDLQCEEFEDDLMSGTFQNESITDVLEAIKIQYDVE